MNKSHSVYCALLFALCAPFAAHADPVDIVRTQCASCHSLDKPDYAVLGVAERGERKAPPLYYAGNKFQPQWLEAWLQNPQRIRPAGVVPQEHVRTSPDGDTIDPATLDEHPTLGAADAAGVAQFLMTLRPFDALIEAQTYRAGEISLRMGQMNFGKFKGCNGCHRDAPTEGGVSGPELYTAWQRLQPAFMASFIADPVAWDPHTIMPRAGLNETEVGKLVNYFKALRQTQP